MLLEPDIVRYTENSNYAEAIWYLKIERCKMDVQKY